MDSGEEFLGHNPLTEYLVLKTLFRHLNFEQLKTARFVCKSWNEAAWPFLTQNCIIKLHNSNSISIRSYNEYRKRLSAKAEKESAVRIPSFSNFSIKLVESCEGESPLSLFEEFWNTNRVSVKELTLDLSPNLGSAVLKSMLCSSIETLQLSALKVRVLKFFDNHGRDESHEEDDDSQMLGGDAVQNSSLKYLEYTHYAFDNSSYRFPMHWGYLFGKFRRIKELLFTGISDSELTEILSQVSAHHLSLETVQILNENAAPETPTTEHLRRLIDLNLNCLESLFLEIGPEIDFLILESLLIKYHKSLKRLHLRRFPFEQNRFRFSADLNMSNLSELRMSDRFISDLSSLVNFHKLSSLEILIRDYSRLTETDLFENTRHLRPILGITKLVVEPLVTLECVRKIVKWFPRLEYLKLRVDDIMARLIFMDLRNLKELYFIALIKTDNFNLQRVSLTDEGITGIPLPVLKQFDVLPERDRIMPYIGDLQDLQKLTIESWHDNTSGITDFSICYGLIDLPKLRYVHLERTLVSKQGFELLSSLPRIEHVSQT